jgi:hypothetical protein
LEKILLLSEINKFCWRTELICIISVAEEL